jgi:hypothetical protein
MEIGLYQTLLCYDRGSVFRVFADYGDSALIRENSLPDLAHA